jgi:rhodanese-related sulfurtransferase
VAAGALARSAAPGDPDGMPSAADAHAHFSARLQFETDCADVAADLRDGTAGYTILDVRGAASYAAGHVPGALHVPSGAIDEGVVAGLPAGDLVVYCWGPGCNGAQKAGAALAAHGRACKEMLGGFEYWIREGQPIEGERADELAERADHALVG